MVIDMEKKVSGKIKVTQIASSRGCVKKTQVANLKGLGLGRIGKQSILDDNGCTRGMIRKVAHLVNVEVTKQ